MRARESQREVPAERIARDDDPREAIGLRELADDERGIVDQAGVIEAGPEAFGAAAVALVEQDRVEPGLQCLVGEPPHVVRLARSFESVQREQRRARVPLRLPVTVREDLRIGRDLEQARLGFGQPKHAPCCPAPHRHDMSPLEAAAGSEWFHRIR